MTWGHFFLKLLSSPRGWGKQDQPDCPGQDFFCTYNWTVLARDKERFLNTFPWEQRCPMERLLSHPLIPNVIFTNSSIAGQVLQPGFGLLQIAQQLRAVSAIHRPWQTALQTPTPLVTSCSEVSWEVGNKHL